MIPESSWPGIMVMGALEMTAPSSPVKVLCGKRSQSRHIGTTVKRLSPSPTIASSRESLLGITQPPAWHRRGSSHQLAHRAEGDRQPSTVAGPILQGPREDSTLHGSCWILGPMAPPRGRCTVGAAAQEVISLPGLRRWALEHSHPQTAPALAPAGASAPGCTAPRCCCCCCWSQI